jgi:putative membrane protein
MDRRALLAGIAVSSVTLPVVAQTGGSSATQQVPGAAAGGMSRTGGQMSQADMQHMQQTMMLGMVAMESSRLAQQKAQNAELKQFAQFEVEEQQTLSEVLRSMMEPAATAATGSSAAQQAGGQAGGASMQMSGDARQMMERLSQASGAEFDRQYLQMQLKGHTDLRQVQERYLQSNPQNREHVNVAKLARGRILEHIALLEDMQRNVR